MSVGNKIAEASHSIESQKIIAGKEVNNATGNVLNDNAVKKRKHRKRSKGGMLVWYMLVFHFCNLYQYISDRELEKSISKSLLTAGENQNVSDGLVLDLSTSGLTHSTDAHQIIENDLLRNHHNEPKKRKLFFWTYFHDF